MAAADSAQGVGGACPFDVRVLLLEAKFNSQQLEKEKRTKDYNKSFFVECLNAAANQIYLHAAYRGLNFIWPC